LLLLNLTPVLTKLTPLLRVRIATLLLHVQKAISMVCGFIGNDTTTKRNLFPAASKLLLLQLLL
jgi:hypothetical protein